MIERTAKAMRESTTVGILGLRHIHPAHFEALARMVVKTLRDPTEAMDIAALDVGPDRAPDEYWRAMIDAALAEE